MARYTTTMKADFNYNDFFGYVFVQYATIEAEFRVSIIMNQGDSTCPMPSKRFKNQLEATKFYMSVCNVIYSGKIEAYTIEDNNIWN